MPNPIVQQVNIIINASLSPSGNSMIMNDVGFIVGLGSLPPHPSSFRGVRLGWSCIYWTSSPYSQCTRRDLHPADASQRATFLLGRVQSMSETLDDYEPK